MIEVQCPNCKTPTLELSEDGMKCTKCNQKMPVGIIKDYEWWPCAACGKPLVRHMYKTDKVLVCDFCGERYANPNPKF